MSKSDQPKPSVNDPSKIRLAEASALLGVSAYSLRQGVHRGELRSYTGPRGTILLDRAELERWGLTLPPRPEALDPSVRWLSAEEARELSGMASSTAIWTAIKRGHLRSTLCRNGQRLVAEPDLQAWMEKSQRLARQPNLEGEPLTLERASRLYGANLKLLREAVRQQEIPVAEQPEERVGSKDVEAFLRRFRAGEVWSVERAADFLGLCEQQLKQAILDGQLPSSQGLTVNPDQLVEWYLRLPVPYRPEASHLSPLLTIEEVARAGPRPQAFVRRLVEKGRLQEWRGMFPRVHLDRWLENRRLPPTWQESRPRPPSPKPAKPPKPPKPLRKPRTARAVGTQPAAPSPANRQPWRLYTLAEAAALANVSRRAADRELARGGFYCQVVDGRELFPEPEIRRWLASRRQ